MAEEKAPPINLNYVILEDQSRQSLERRVNIYMSWGWAPQGGLSAYKCTNKIGFEVETNYTMYLQAMVRV